LIRVRWSPEAVDDLERIVNYIRKENPSAARSVAYTIYNRISTLRGSPLRGRIGRIDGTRELVFSPLPYIAVYRVRGEIVEIVRIYHAAQNWP
jgi:toxin ParE1/3/4